MKKAKKLAALLLALAMTFALGVPAFADTTVTDLTEKNGVNTGSDKGSITISDTDKGQTYTIYKLLDAEIDEEESHADASGNQPISYYVYSNTAVYTWLTGKSSQFKLTETTTPGKYQVTALNGNVSSAIIATLSTMTVDQIKALNLVGFSCEAKGDKIEFKNIPYGYYWMKAENGQGGAGVSVTSTQPNGTMYIKATRQPSNPQKVVDEKSVEIGQTLTYQSSFKAVNFAERITSSDITAADRSKMVVKYEFKDIPDEDATFMEPISYRVFTASALKTAGVIPAATEGGSVTYISNLDDDGNIKLLAEDVKDASGNYILNEDGVALRAGMEDLYQKEKDTDGKIKIKLKDGKAVYVTNTKLTAADPYTAPDTNNPDRYYVDGTKNVTVIPWAKQVDDDNDSKTPLVWQSLYESPSYVVATYTQTVGAGIMSQAAASRYDYMDTNQYIGDETDDPNYVAGMDRELNALYNTAIFSSKEKLADQTALLKAFDAAVEAGKAPGGTPVANPEVKRADLAAGKYEERVISPLDGEFLNQIQVSWIMEDNSTPETPLEAEASSSSTGISMRKLVYGGSDFDILSKAIFTLTRLEECAKGTTGAYEMTTGSGENTVTTYYKVKDYYAMDMKAASTVEGKTNYENILALEAAYAAATGTAKIEAEAALKAAYAGLWTTTAANAAEIEADNLYETMEFAGLKEGVYLLTEIDAPAGYETPAEPIAVKIVYNASSDHYTVYSANGNSKAYTFTSDMTLTFNENEFFTAKVYNSKSAELPSTGGAGTVALIGIGTVLFLCTGIVLVTKKRMYNAG